MTLLPDFTHGQFQAAELPELLRFANEQNGLGAGNIRIDALSFDGDRAVVSFTLPEDAKHASACVYYRSSPLEYEDSALKEAWKVKKGAVLGNAANLRIPEEATMYYIMIEAKAGPRFERQTIHATTGILVKD